MDLPPSRLIGLLVIAILVAIAARRLRLPYTVGLVVTGIGLALAHVPLGAALTHDIVFDVILPPLLFEAAIAIHWHDFRRDAEPILILSVAGVVIAAGTVAAGMVWLLGWAIAPALVFGVLTAATDPVAVIALFKDNGVTGRLRLLVESESLLNDGVAAVLFAVALSWSAHTGSTPLGWREIVGDLAMSSAGGLLVGIACGYVAILAVGRTEDHLVETAVTAAAAWGAFLLAERAGFSGVLATVASGVLIGNVGRLTHEHGEGSGFAGRDFVPDFWEFAAFLGYSLIFLLIGGRLGAIAFARVGWVPLLTAILLVLAGRALTIYPLGAAFSRTRWAIPLRDLHVLWWGGLRGALALALALSLPENLDRRDEIVIATFAVVAFSVILQGLTMPMLLRATGVRKRHAVLS